MTRLYAIEPWRLAVTGGAAGFAYAFTPHAISRGHFMPLVAVIFTIDQLVGQRTGKQVFGHVGLPVGLLALGALEFALLRPGVDPGTMALFAAAVALVQLSIFWRAARSLPLSFDTTLKRAAGLVWAAISVLLPPAAILAAGVSQLALQLAWTASGVLPSFLVLKALDRPALGAASIETP